MLSGIKYLFRPAKRNAEIEAKLQSYSEAAVDYKMRQGMSREIDERAARAEVGSSEMVRHKVWVAGWESHAESIWNDARYGLRQIVRSPGLSIVAILSLALGIGANTAIFIVIDDLLLKPLPVHDPQMLVSFGDGSIFEALRAGIQAPGKQACADHKHRHPQRHRICRIDAKQTRPQRGGPQHIVDIGTAYKISPHQ